MRPFYRFMLLEYKIEDYQTLNANGIGYELKIKQQSWWGLFTKVVTHKSIIPYHVDGNKHYDSLLNKWKP